SETATYWVEEAPARVEEAAPALLANRDERVVITEESSNYCGWDGSGVKRLEKDEISFLEEELVQLTVKSSMVVPSENLTLLCLIWTKKSYNPDSFRAQMKIIWKTRKNFEIQVVGQNLFLIVFETEEDLEMVMEGWPWLFRKQLIIFDRLVTPVERNQIRLSSSSDSGTFALSKSRNEDWMLDGHDEANVHKEQSIVEKVEGLNGSDSMLEGKSKITKEESWKRIAPGVIMNESRDERVVGKRKLAKIGIYERRTTNSCKDGFKRTKLESMDLHTVAHSNLMMENS
ncbi:hypothetical protein Gorai_006554, partial [Gossypium raimondii]|nr:hypothetical protein [Gossypium raimondii]